MIHTFELFPGVTLRCYPDHRFKHSCLSLQLVRPMCQEEAAFNALKAASSWHMGRTSCRLRQLCLNL